VNTRFVTTCNSIPAVATDRYLAKWLGLAALGVVFGNLGRSPLYALQTVVQTMGDQFTPAGAIGILLPIVWTLILTISVKYSLFVARVAPAAASTAAIGSATVTTKVVPSDRNQVATGTQSTQFRQAILDVIRKIPRSHQMLGDESIVG
jgi:hypothetical protein